MNKTTSKKANKITLNKVKKPNQKLRLHHRVKQSFYSKHPFFVPLFTIIFLGIGSVIIFLMFGGQVVKPADTKIVHFHSQGRNLTVPTRAITVKDFLQRTDFKVEEGDVVEPSLSSPITGEEFSINLYKAKLVTVTDEKGKKTVTKTAETVPEVVARKAGYKLYPEDRVEVATPNEAISSGVIGTQIKVQQALPVKLVLYGKSYEVRTRSKTVGELVKERGVAFDNGSVLPKPSTKVSDNLVVFVTEPGKQLVTGEEVIPKGQETILDNNLDFGKSEVRNEGSDGKKAIIYELLPGGQRKYLQEVVITQPVKRLVVKGSKAPLLAPNVSVSGDKIALMAAAGISSSDYSAVDFIISHESGWRPGAGNPSSGAYGLCQALPASKMATAGSDYLTNPVTQLKWCSGYASGRYRGWQGAYSFWVYNRWW